MGDSYQYARPTTVYASGQVASSYVRSGTWGEVLLVGVLMVGNPGLGVLNVHRPTICNDTACTSLYKRVRTRTTKRNMRIRVCRSGRRNSLISGVRTTCNGISNVIVGPTTCARADMTLLSTLGTMTVPAMRMRVSSISGQRSFHRVDCIHTTYYGAVTNRNFTNCLRTVSRLLARIAT